MFEVVFIDMDNTIAENATCQNVEFVDGLYENKRPIFFVINAIDQLLRNNANKIVLVTVCQGGDVGKQEKLLWLKKIEFDYDDIIFVEPFRPEKSFEMIAYCKENGHCFSNCILIDDKKDILQKAEDCGFKVKYPQQLLVDYYEYLKNKEYTTC